MANNHIYSGDVQDWTNDSGSDVVSGQVVAVGATLGIAQVDIASGAVGSIAFEDVWAVPKADGAVIAHGDFVTWDASAGNFDDDAATPAAGDVTLGAWAAESKGATVGETIEVRLTGHPGTLA